MKNVQANNESAPPVDSQRRIVKRVRSGIKAGATRPLTGFFGP